MRENVKYPKGYAFVQFLHEESVEYASQLLGGITLYGKQIRVSPAGRQEEQTPSPVTGRTPNGIPLLQSPVDSQQMPASSLQGRPSPMYPPSGPLYSTPHPISPQLSGSSTPQQEVPHPPYPCLPSPHGPYPLSPPGVQHSPHGPPQGYIPVGGNRYNGVSPWQQDGYPSGGLINTQIHESRAYAHDHPHWLSSEARQHLSEFHTSRLPGSLPQDDHRRARSRSPQDNHGPARSRSSHRSHRSRTRSLHQQQQGPPRRAYSYHDGRDDYTHSGRGGPALLRSLSHDGNQPIISRGNQTHRYQGRLQYH